MFISPFYNYVSDFSIEKASCHKTWRFICKTERIGADL